MKPVLVSEHKNKALSFIRDIENVYLPLVRVVADEIKSLGLTPTEHHIRAVLTDGPEVIRGNYLAYAGRDVTSNSSIHVKRHMESLHSNVFAEFITRVTPWLDVTIGSRSVRNPLFQELIAFDETGMPYITDQGREKVMDQFKEYISDPKLLKVHEACAAAAAGMQALWQALEKSGIAANLGIDFSGSEAPGWTFEKFTLRILTEHLTITGARGKYVIEPRQINYKNLEPLTIENDGE